MASSQAAILGGTPVRTEPFAQRKTMGEREVAQVIEVMESDVLSAYIGGAGKFFMGGPRVRGLEQAWCEAFGYKHAISVNSWTSGLMVAAGAVGVEPGCEVITSPYTMSASATSMMFYGGVPVFADIDPETCALDPASIEARITPRTRAIVVVHLFGYPADMDAINALAAKHGIAVIEDAAQAPGALYKGKPVGALGDIGGFSFNFHKHIHCGEGGLLVTDDDRLARASQLIRNHGENAATPEEVERLPNFIGGNYRLTEIQAAIGQVQLERLGGYLEHRGRLAAHLRARLEELPGIRAQRAPQDGSTHAYYIFPMFFDAQQAGISRNLFLRALLAELPEPVSFETTPMTEGYVKPLYLNALYQKQRALGQAGYPFAYNPDIDYSPLYQPGACPVAERLYQRELLLSPLLREPLSIEDIDHLADAIEKVLEQAPAIVASLGDEDAGEVFNPVAAANKTHA